MALPEDELRRLFTACADMTRCILHDQVDKGLECVDEISEEVNSGRAGFQLRINTEPNTSVQLLLCRPNGELRLLGRYEPKIEKKLWLN